MDYTNIDIPADESPENYHYTVRRAEILQKVFREGTPSAMNQSELADRYGVDQSTISRDLDALAEFIDDTIGSRAKLTARAAFERVVRELMEDDDWRATKAAWDVIMDWNDWLADIGEQHREPEKSELDVDMETRTTEVSYTVVRGGDPDDLPSDNDGGVDYEKLGFTKAPADIDVEDPHEETNQ